jgi:hypothetical protein
MKTLLALVFSVGVVFTCLAADQKKAPGKDAKKEESAKIEGVVVPRGDKGFLGIQIINSTYKVTFYDPKKKPTAPDMGRAILRWRPNYKPTEERYVLNPGGDEFSLVSPRVVRPPYVFKLYITLLKGEAGAEGDQSAGENYVVDFHQ